MELDWYNSTIIPSDSSKPSYSSLTPILFLVNRRTAAPTWATVVLMVRHHLYHALALGRSIFLLLERKSGTPSLVSKEQHHDGNWVSRTMSKTGAHADSKRRRGDDCFACVLHLQPLARGFRC
ncbi:unnamed protein product [Calypogeia fissa]